MVRNNHPCLDRAIEEYLLDPFFVSTCPSFIERAAVDQTQCYQSKIFEIERVSHLKMVISELSAILSQLAVGLQFAAFRQDSQGTKQEFKLCDPSVFPEQHPRSLAPPQADSTNVVFVGSDVALWFNGLPHILQPVGSHQG